MSTPATTLLDAITACDQQLAAVSEAAMHVPAAEPSPASRFVLLSINGAHYAIPEAFVTELDRVPRITVVPQTPAWMRGVTNVRGDIVSVIDMRTFIGLDFHNQWAVVDAKANALGLAFSDGGTGKIGA